MSVTVDLLFLLNTALSSTIPWLQLPAEPKLTSQDCDERY